MTLILPRRRFLTGLASALAAPVIVRAESLMPIKASLVPEPLVPLGSRIVFVGNSWKSSFVKIGVVNETIFVQWADGAFA